MTITSLLSLAGAVLCAGLAAFVLFKDPKSLVHRAFGLGMTALAFTELCVGMAAQATTPLEVIYWRRLGWIPLALVPGSWFLFSLCFAQSQYRSRLRKWRWLVVSAFVVPLALVGGFRAELLALPAEFGTSPDLILPLGWSGYALYVFMLLATVATLINLEGTLRASTGTKRWQIKFMILGLGGFFAVQVYTTSQIILFSAVTPAMEALTAFAIVLANSLIIVSLVRTRDFNVDIYLSEVALYNSLTALIAGIYLLAVGVLAKTISLIGGAHNLPLGAFVIFLSLLGLTVVLLSDELQQRVKRFIHRQFRRPRHDYRTVWSTVSRRTADLVETSPLCSAVCRIVSETFGVPSVTIWLTDESSERPAFGASTALSNGQAQALRMTGTGPVEILKYFQDQSLPVDFDRPSDSRTAGLNRDHVEYFQAAQIRYCAPLAAGNQVLGILTLSDRVTKEPFSLEDFDVLKAIADQAAGSLLNLKLSARLMRAKEMEAFQTVSAFFIHDLKNLASMLSLTLQNLPTHYDNPAFRNDMLRAMSESVAKMNAMCGRLSLPKDEPELHRTKTDLNELVSTTLTSLNGSLKTSLIQNLHSLPEIEIDSDQMQKVLINLVLNANEAITGDGEIRITTDRLDRWVTISVSDNGCGMSRDFVARHLFRQFQTTKPKGLGIGLFHSKMIVDAHRGRIEVESEEGKGSTFRIMLPLTS